MSPTLQLEHPAGAAEATLMRVVAHLRAGGCVGIYDEQREQADVVAAACGISASTVNVLNGGGGLVSVALTPTRQAALGLTALPLRRSGGRPMCDRTPAFVSVEARFGVTTGISAADRAQTIRTLADAGSTLADLVSPGHVFPFVAAEGGLLERHGRLEAAVDLMRLAGLKPAAAICDVLDSRGDLAGLGALHECAALFGGPVVTIAAVQAAREAAVWADV